MRTIALLAALVVLPLAAHAQNAPQPAAAPKPSCQKPDEYPGRLASDTRKKQWTRDFNTYVECMKKFVDDQKAIGDLHYNAAQTAITTVNKDIQDFNAAQKE